MFVLILAISHTSAADLMQHIHCSRNPLADEIYRYVLIDTWSCELFLFFVFDLWAEPVSGNASE